ncbi:hypothetical protein TWF694_011616 [Orbilia ellipsospora]|uniref:Uncharacterized protein n=1 Tax=Orbilia ellipsospora TaxID=2528407 RepID=A0AAV9X5S6_9PEZI
MESNHESGLKRKRALRWPDGKGGSLLQRAAAAALVRHLGIYIEPGKVNINGHPFSKKRTVYVWRAHGEITDEESELLANTVSSTKITRFPSKWSADEVGVIIQLIENDVLVPEKYHDEVNNGVDIGVD